MSVYMKPVSTIVLGIAFVLEGGRVAGSFTRLPTETTRIRFDESGLNSGVSAEAMGGIMGFILGILTFLNMSLLVFLPSAASVFGGKLDFSSSILHGSMNCRSAEWVRRLGFQGHCP